MADLSVSLLTSPAELRTCRLEWDDLWRRSAALPLAQSAAVEAWLTAFAPHGAFRTVVVRQGSQWTAALPLYGTVWKRVLPVGDLPGNHWSGAGELLLDQGAGDETLDALVEGLARLPWPMLRLGGLDAGALHWRRLIEALRRRGLDAVQRPRFEAARVTVPDDWEAYFAARSRNHRRYVRKHERLLAEAGGAQLMLLESFEQVSVETALAEALAVEDSGWKGAEGTSILRSPRAAAFFAAQAHALAGAGQLRVALLKHGANGAAMACAYGFEAGGRFGLSKIGYDERFAELAPGQMLIYELLRELSRRRPGTVVDFLGPLNEGLARWSTHTYTVGRLAIAQRGLVGRALWGAYRRLEGRAAE